jgi:predicted permease
VIALGAWLKARAYIPEAGWGVINRLGYQVLFPAYLVVTIARADFSGGDAGVLVLSGSLGFLAMGGLLLLSLPWTGKDGPAYTSVFQGSVRWNGFAILAAVESIYGAPVSGLLAAMFGPCVLLVNLMCVLVMLKWGRPAEAFGQGINGLLAALVSNPLIIACALGLAINLAGFGLWPPLAGTLDLIGRGALGLALLTVGAGISLTELGARPGLLAFSTTMKLLVAPVVFWGIGLALGLEGAALTAMVAAGAAPGAASAYTLAREMGGDASLIAGHISLSTLLAGISIPLALALLAPGVG